MALPQGSDCENIFQHCAALWPQDWETPERSIGNNDLYVLDSGLCKVGESR